ncbi:class II aldolase/adducin family protein [Mangrovicoccus ximenensis]|uniref:class II aldolase/adducin family protein n=1 Tax=Mangrovicoccus ximenensis TaxID=1911570 RepID=UPI001F24B202|nr:class II aldolase/adducin family protein [Mangrovicoccus ximenensis]
MEDMNPGADTLLKDPPPPEYSCDTEWKARVDLAACYRLLAHFGMADTVYGHATVRVPGSPDEYLINPFGMMFEEVTASSLVKVDHTGLPVDGVTAVNAAGFVIHSAIHAARPDVDCVIHTHTRAGVALSCLAEGLLPINQFALEFSELVRYHDYEGIALDLAEQERLVADLGSSHTLVLRNHGMLTAGRTVPGAFYLFYYLEQAAKVQMDVMASGGKIVTPPVEVQKHTAGQYASAFDPDKTGLRGWPAMLRLLGRHNPGYDQ